MSEPAFSASMSNSDALMWAIEQDPVLRTTIVAVALLDKRPDWARLQRRLTAAADAVPRLHQRVSVPPFKLAPPQWVDDPDFAFDYHLRRVAVPAHSGFDAVLEIAQVAAMSCFDRARPLWEFTLVEGLPGGQAALIEKVHHTVTDGVGGIRLYEELLDADRAGRHPFAGDAGARTAGTRNPPNVPASMRELLDRQVRRAATRPGRFASTARRAAGALARDPIGSIRGFATMTGSAAQLLAPVPSALSPVMQGRGLAWHLDAFDLPLDDLKRAAKVAGGSVNDAYLAALAGGLARYHRKHGVDVPQLRIDIPVNVRGPNDPPGGNRFVPVRGVLPMDISDPAERTRRLGAIVAEWRREPALQLVDGLSAVLNRLPGPVVAAVFGEMLKHVDFTATNVPGIPMRSYLAGAEILRHWAFAAPSGTAVNFALLSHVDHACIGINSDNAAVPDPDVLTACVREGFDEVVALGAERKAS